MPVDNPSLDREQEEIIDVISDNEGISQGEISQALDYNPTKVYRKVKKLKENNLVEDKEWKGDKTRYILADNVTVSKNFRLETIFNYSITAHFFELIFLVGLLYYFPVENYDLIIFTFLSAFTPSLLVSLNYLLEEDDLHEIQVTNNKSSETTPE